jgi:hypothetical protein
MAKMPKKIQTDYTTGGRDISNTAVPLYQQSLQSMGDYLSDPTSYIDDYLKYYNNTAQQNDFARDYNRLMQNKIAQNYNALGGGYSSSGQRAYDDTQRYANDYASRLQAQNLSNATNLAQNYYSNLLSSLSGYNQAYGLGRDYSDIEQYNNLADQNNSFGNQALSVGGNLASSAGKVLSAIPNPVTQGIGAGLQGAGALMNSQTLDMGGVMGSSGSSNNAANTWSNLSTSVAQGLGQTGALGRFADDSLLGKALNAKKEGN